MYIARSIFKKLKFGKFLAQIHYESVKNINGKIKLIFGDFEYKKFHSIPKLNKYV